MKSGFERAIEQGDQLDEAKYRAVLFAADAFAH